MQYAEQTLEVHVPWEDAKFCLDVHAETTLKVDELRRKIRGHKQRIEDRKMEVATEAPSHPDYPPDGVTKQRDFLKVLLGNDQDLSDLESALDAMTSDLEHHTSLVKHQELRLYALTARMNELGGLLNFYAVAKSAETQVQHEPASEPAPAPPAPSPFT